MSIRYSKHELVYMYLCPRFIYLESDLMVSPKVLDHFLNALKSMGDSWIDNSEWIAKSKFWSSSVGKNQSDRLGIAFTFTQKSSHHFEFKPLFFF